MAIRKHVDYSSTKGYVGYVDMGTGDISQDVLATECLTLMLTAVNDSWKIPIGYFLIHGLSGKEKANLVRLALEKTFEAGVIVISVTCDGPSSHFSMLTELGLQLDVKTLSSGFPHPSNPSQLVYGVLDCAHMIKLVRNSFEHFGRIKDADGNEIDWKYVKQLQELQENEGLRAGNKLKKAHIHFKQQKMKVNLATQLLSSSVANAIEFADKDIGLPEFKGSEGKWLVVIAGSLTIIVHALIFF